jgi:hypothetical protein
VRCEADHKDGGVCLTVLVNGTCPHADTHAVSPLLTGAVEVIIKSKEKS